MNPLILSACKGVMNMAGMALLAVAVEGFWDAKFLLELGVILVGIVSVAAVMRSRVDALEKAVRVRVTEEKFTALETQVSKIDAWQDKHDDEVTDYKDTHASLHNKINESLVLLRQMADESHRRVTELEAERWRSSRT